MRPHTTLSRLGRIPQAIAGERTYEGVLSAIADELREILPFDHIDIVMLVAEGRDHICYETPVRTIWSTFAESPQPTGSSPVRAVLSGALPYILSPDAFTDERFHFEGALDKPIFEAKLRSRVIVPLQVRGMVFGSINISSRNVNAYGAMDLLLGRRCAEMVAPYVFALMTGRAQGRGDCHREIEAFRASLISLAHQMEQDRRRLRMDLHDQTIGDLSRLARKAASIDASSLNLRPAMAELQTEIGHCLTELRRIVDDSLPAVLDLFGFADAVEEMMRRSQSGLGSPMQLKLEDFSEGAVDRLPELSRTLLYRIVQEAVNNAVQHSGAARLAVRIRCCGEILDITVEDDGRGGVDPQSPRGISHMRSRAALIGGTVNFARGARNRGTRVGLQLPLSAARRTLSH